MTGMFIKTERGWVELRRECSNANDLQGVYRPPNADILRVTMAARAERFCKALDEFHPVHNASEFSGTQFKEPLTGAFGEKL